MAGTAGGEKDWETALDEILAGLSADTKFCRYSPRHVIHRAPGGGWEDEAGGRNCGGAIVSSGGNSSAHEPEAY